MQNSTNQRSLSDSPETYPNGHEAYDNGAAANGAAPQQAEIDVDPVTEPEFLEQIEDAHDQREPEPAPVVSLADAPHPSESTVYQEQGRGRSLRMQWRYFRTLLFAAWLFVRLLFWQVYVAKVARNWVERTNMNRWKRYAREYSNFAAKMGGVFIKLGQFISTRVDILPEEIIKEMENLQDEVPTINFKKIEAVLLDELGPIEQRFEYFNREPIAAASLGQVHRARLRNGDKVVVKVQRPGIRAICFTDLDAMNVVARVAMWFNFVSRRCDAAALVDEFGRVFLQELSYKHEAYNAAQFAEMFKNNMGVYIPAVYYEHSTDQILTLEDVTSIKITDYEAMERVGISRRAVAKRLMDTYLDQIFNEYFFHADPHPGNLFVYPLPVEDENADFGKNGRPFYLIFIDFGMTGTLTHEIANGMVSTLSAVINRDARQLINSYINLGFIMPTADVERIVKAAEAAFNQVWGMSMTEMRDIDYDKVTDLADEFSDLMLSMPFYIPQDFIYIGRTISILSGLTTSLEPTFNPWSEMQPYTETLIARGFGIEVAQGQSVTSGLVIQNLLRGNGTEAIRNIGEQLVKRTLTPNSSIEPVLRQLQEGDVHVVSELSIAHRQQLKRMEKETRRNGRSVFFGSVLIAATLFYTSGEVTVAIIGYVICGLTLVIGWIKD